MMEVKLAVPPVATEDIKSLTALPYVDRKGKATYLPAPPPKDVPAEFIPARTK